MSFNYPAKTELDKITYNAVCGHANEMYAGAWFIEGFRKSRSMIIEELKNIAAQNEDQSIIALVTYFQDFGEDEIKE